MHFDYDRKYIGNWDFDTRREYNYEINFVNENYYDDSNVMITQMQWHP